MTSFAIATPSRGLIHSRTVASALANIDAARIAGHEYKGWAITHDLPIPLAHERCAEMALATGAACVLFLEEDNVPPPGALVALLALGTPIAALDYPIGDGPTLDNCIAHRPNGDPWFVGLGCTLIAREVFEGLERPWFRTNEKLEYTHYGTDRVDVKVVPGGYEYGGEDINFSLRAGYAGFRIAEIPPSEMVCGHAVLRNMGTPSSNDGAHKIDVREQIGRWH